MFRLSPGLLRDSSMGYSPIIDPKYSVIYDQKKFSEYAADMIVWSTLTINDEEVLKELAKINMRKISKELNRIMGITPEYVKTQYFNDLMRLYRIYYEALY